MESGTSSAPIDNTAHNTTKQPEKQADHVQLKDHVTLLELADRRGGKELKRQTDAIKNIVQSYDSHSWNRYEGRHELLRKLAFRGRLEAIQLLLQPGRGADVNAPDGQGATALHEAAHGGHSHVVELLIAQGADVSIRTFGLGESALHYALRRTKLEGPFKGTPDTVALLLLHRADPNCLTKHYHHTPLHYAAMHRHDTSTKTLLEYGANILSRDNDGNLALHHAACKGHHEVVPLLLVKNKADTVDYLNHAGETPLYKAAHNIGKVENEVSPSVNYRETVKVLLAWNADIRLKIKGRSMVDWAESPDADPEIAGQILRKAREHQYQFRKTDEGGVIAEMTMLQSKALRESNCSLKAHVLSFYAGSELCPGSHHAECPISDLVYGDGLQQCLKQVKVERPEETPLFTWYHLPANHLEWIKMPYLSLEAHCQQLKYSTNVRERHSIQTDVKVPTLAVLDYNRGTLAEEFPGSGLRQTLDQYYYVHLGDTRDRDSSQVLLRARGGEVISTDGDKAVLNKEMDRFRRQWWPEERESPEEPGGFDNCDADIIMVDQLWVFVIGQSK
ncbi:MAG: hypothetical protein M1822_007678 [Bathelium mastoideum]|nr:MAG: hypothetical protein M1822_007678 [Bathelium mastoideum]